MIPVLITPRAETELEEIWLFIAQDNPKAADKTLLSLSNAIKRLAHLPRLGLRRPDLRTQARVLLHAHFLVLYQIYPDQDEEAVEQVEIVSVVDGRRDLLGLL